MIFRSIVGFIALLCLPVAAMAANVDLTAVLYPAGKVVNVPMQSTARAPAADLKAAVQFSGGQSVIQLGHKHLVPALLFGGDINTYVVWAVTPGGKFENLGTMGDNGKHKGQLVYSTPLRDFALMVTAEPIGTTRVPSETVVFYSGPPEAKGAKLTAFTFSGLVEWGDIIERNNDSIAGMTYEADKNNPVRVIQANAALGLAQRLDAKTRAPKLYKQAVQAAGEMRELKGKKRLDAADKTITLAGSAITSIMLNIEQSMRQDLVETAEDAMLSEAEATGLRKRLTSAEANVKQLRKQQAALREQLSGAIGTMASGTKTETGYMVSVKGTAFGSGKATLTTDAKYTIAKLSGMLLAFPDMKLSIEGHTDSSGSAEVNQKLSLARAREVMNFLKEMGTDPARMTAVGHGSAKPIAPNDTKEGMAKNRRVDIVLSRSE